MSWCCNSCEDDGSHDSECTDRFMTAEVDDNHPLTATNPYPNSRSDASLASVNSGDSHGGRSPAHPTRVDCGQGRVEATVDIGNGLAPYNARNIPLADTSGIVHYVSCIGVFPHRVLNCPRDGCGRHAARQSGDPSSVELYCCVPCAQLEGHSDRCDRAYSTQTLMGGPPGTPLVGDTHFHGPGLAVCGCKINGDGGCSIAHVSGSPS